MLSPKCGPSSLCLRALAGHKLPSFQECGACHPNANPEDSTTQHRHVPIKLCHKQSIATIPYPMKNRLEEHGQTMSALVEGMSDGFSRKAKKMQKSILFSMALRKYCRFASLIQVIDLPRDGLAASHEVMLPRTFLLS